jgi:hypothetical protein
MERGGVLDYIYLASTIGSSTSISSTYIVFVTKMQKGKPPKNDLPLLENDITDSESTFKMTDILQIHAILNLFQLSMVITY